MLPKICSIPECNKVVTARGWCAAHYNRWRRYGDPVLGGPIQMRHSTPEQKFWAKVSKSDNCWEWNGSKTTSGYANLNFGQGKYGYAHRLSYELHYGPIPEDLMVDHICRNRGCVNPDHLRAVTRSQNNQNIGTRQGSNKTTGIRGVHFESSSGSYVTYAGSGDSRVYGPRCSNLKEAAGIARDLRLKMFTHNEEDRNFSD